MDSVIRFENVSKKYSIGRLRYRSLREDISYGFKKIFSPPKKDDTTNFIWALKDVSFEVKQGEALGIIGPNGAGKTTILKLLSRITLPAKGRISVKGRVATLIELGAGFHPELSGRENIYLNGSILGMKKTEINRKFSDIIEFAELERFIDTPVKYYSSGMFVRLGFAVAIHCEPDILLVDEVLAVGDMEFRSKCIDRLKKLRDRGITVVFVSHNLDSVNGVCGRALFLNEGKIVTQGETADVIQSYRDYVDKEALIRVKRESERQEEIFSKEVRIDEVQFLDEERKEKHIFSPEEKMIVRVKYISPKRILDPIFGIFIDNSDGLRCCIERTNYYDIKIDYIQGAGFFEIEFDSIQLSGGRYILGVVIFDPTTTLPYSYRQQDAFKVEYDKPPISMRRPVFHPRLRWTINRKVYIPKKRG